VLTKDVVEKLWNSYRSGTPGTESITLPIRISSALTVKGTFSISSHGNGVLSLPGVRIRLFDSNQDGVIFDGFLLENELVDIDQDGFSDLVVWGTAIQHDDEGGEIGRRSVVSIFWYDARQAVFRNTLKSVDVIAY